MRTKDRVVSAARRRGRLWVALPTAFLLVLAACGGEGTDTAVPGEGDTEAGSAAPGTYTSADEIVRALEAGGIECTEFEKPANIPSVMGHVMEYNPDITDTGTCQHRETETLEAETIRFNIYVRSSAQDDRWGYFCADDASCVYAPTWLVVLRPDRFAGTPEGTQARKEFAERMSAVLGAEQAWFH